MRTLRLATQARSQIMEITGLVNEALRDMGAGDGLCHLFVPHTTAGLTVNEGFDPEVAADVLDRLAARAPEPLRPPRS